jgi:hypothetical protein
MGKTAYPTSTDLDSFLTAAGFSLGTLDTATAIAAAIDDFERRAGRIMLRGAADLVRAYDPPYGQPLLVLEFDLHALTDLQIVPVGGGATLLTQNTDYLLRSYNAGPAFDAEAGPFSAVEFLTWRWSEPARSQDRRSVRVNGRWGYAAVIPEDAWLAMVMRGAALLAPSRGGTLSGGHVRTADSGVERLYGDDPLRGLRQAWERSFETAVRRYRRLAV